MENTRPEPTPTHETLHVGGQLIRLGEISDALAQLEFGAFILAVKEIIVARGSDQLKLLIDGLEIQATRTAFREDNERNVAILEEVAACYPFTRWCDEMGIETKSATRQHLCQWWTSLMSMAGEHGYVTGQIDAVSRNTNLWKATGPLALKMQSDPAAYRFLPALLINHAHEVERVLGEINEPEPFLEVLTGERMEDIRSSPAFLGAFSCVRATDGTISRTTPDALWSVQLILQRG